MRRAIYIIFIFFSGLVQLAGQIDSVVIEPVIVTASRIGVSQQDLGRQSVIITKTDLIAHNVYSVDEALRYLGGIEVASRGPRGVQSDYSIRGANFNQILILVDGIRANDPLTGHFSSYIPVVMSQIKHIEVIKGASSGVYGAEAVGGVINIVTEKSLDQGRNNPNIHLRLTGGRHDLKEGEASIISQIAPSLTFGAGVQINDTDGEPFQDSLRRDFSYYTHSAFIAYQPSSKWSMRLRHAYDRRDFNAQYFYTRSTFDKSREEVTRLWNSLHSQMQVSDISHLAFDLLHTRTTDDFIFNPLFTGNNHTTHFINSHLKYTSQRKKITHVYGFNYQRHDITSNDRGDHDFDRYSMYGLLHYHFSKSLNVAGGLRYDYDENINHQVSPHVTLNLMLSDNWKTRAYVGRSIRSADFTEKYVSNNLSGPLSAGRNIGNPALLSETAWNFELGIDLHTASNCAISATTFYRADRNLIDFITTAGSEIHDPALVSLTESYFYAQNISSLNSYGLDLEIKTTLQLASSQRLALTGSLLLLGHSQDLEEISKNISNSSDVLFQSSLLYQNKSFGLGLTSIYKHRLGDVSEAIGAQLKSSYYQQNVSLSNKVLDDHITLKVDINNVFNADYSDILGADLPGLWWTGSIIFNW